MSRSNRIRDIAFALALLAVFCIGIYGLLHLLEQQKASQYATDYASNVRAERDRQMEACYRLPYGEQIICVSNAYNAERDANRAEQDVAAQQYMAQTGFWTWIIAWVQSLAAVGGIYFIARTLDANRISTDAALDMATLAKEANETARDAVALTREIGQAQVRAYISCDGGTFEIRQSDLWFEIRMTNRGQSPAFDCDFQGKLILTPTGTEPEFFYASGGFGVVGAGAGDICRICVPWTEIGSDRRALIESQKLQIYLSGKVSWRDIFDGRGAADYAINQKGRLRYVTEQLITTKKLGDLDAVCLSASYQEQAPKA